MLRQPQIAWVFGGSILLGACGGTAPAPTETAAPWLQQNARAIGGADPADDSFGDLAAFGTAIGDAQLVALGEQSHGAGSVFDLKTRLVEYLHEQKGFDALVLESGFFDVARLWQLAQAGARVDDLAPGSIFFMYSKSAEGRRVLQYVDAQRNGARPLVLAGMDSAHTGERSRDELLPMLDAFVRARGSAIPEGSDWVAYEDVVRRAIALDPAAPSPAERDAFTSVSDGLDGELCASPDAGDFPSSPGFWCRVVRSLRNQAERLWNGATNRDIEMAANVEWLLEHPLAGRKVILWGHTRHVGRYGAGTNASLGEELASRYSRRMYVASVTASEGSIVSITFVSGANQLAVTPIAPDRDGSVEAILRSLGAPQLFVDARLLPPPPSLSSTLGKESEYQYVGTTDFGTAYDGLFYSERVAPATIASP